MPYVEGGPRDRFTMRLPVLVHGRLFQWSTTYQPFNSSAKTFADQSVSKVFLQSSYTQINCLNSFVANSSRHLQFRGVFATGKPYSSSYEYGLYGRYHTRRYYVIPHLKVKTLYSLHKATYLLGVSVTD